MHGGWKRRIGDRLADPYRAKPDQGLIDDGACRGLPLGGLGTGSIGRDFDGCFSRWHLTPGAYRHEESPGSWVAVQWGSAQPVVLAAPDVRRRPRCLASCPGGGEYEALFPFAWYRFPGVSLRQWSPVIPGRERESAWPVAYFEVTLRNPDDHAAREVTVALSFELPVEERLVSGPIELSLDGSTAVAQLVESAGSFALGAEPSSAVQAAAAPLRGEADYDRLGSDLWAPVVELAQAPPVAVAPDGRPGLVAAARAALEPLEERTFRFALAWDLPEVKFGGPAGRRWWRAHTREFGRTGDGAPRAVRAALQARAELADAAEAWHAGLRARLAGWGAPGWLLPALCNQLSMLVDGGTAWVFGDAGDEEHFGTLECIDYPFYETIDVRYYSSFVLLELWPRLEGLVMRDVVRAVGQDDPRKVTTDWDGREVVRKVRHAAPHDLGSPGDDPFRGSNAYTLQDTSTWKDLNPKFVLELVRSAKMLADGDSSAALWPVCRDAIAYLECCDHDGDGIPENAGVPDQTYDTWPMTGVSAYCGDLWLAALSAAEWAATRAGDQGGAVRLARLRDRAAVRLEGLLWTGTHYRFDSSRGPVAETIFADQLAGTWYALMLGLPPPHPLERVERALTTVLSSNLRGFAGGRLGVVNGRSPQGGRAEGGAEQADEVWIGVCWGIASLCLLLGRDADAWELGEALYRTIYEDSGLWFRTPEAWTQERQFRAQIYHRPLAVWSLYTALRVRDQTRRCTLSPA
ncbi:MAG TPA: GH116 family glycosyl hydrolase [Candidatus Dormibacteraeota bacterium]|nr:GH116 family glycosyl hydrolase [Candidatus Dormibacteraeota bacterium]